MRPPPDAALSAQIVVAKVSSALPASRPEERGMERKSVQLIRWDGPTDIDPFFENHTEVVSMPPRQAASADCAKVVERDVEIDRKKPETIRMHSSACFAHAVGDAFADFPTGAEEHQACQ
jgi:hypothetical protein